MTDQVTQDLHKRLRRGIGLLATALAVACANGPAAGVDPGQQESAGPKSNQASPVPGSSNASDQNNAIVGNPDATVGSPVTGPSAALAVVHAHAAASTAVGINLMPRLALNECLDVLDATPSAALPEELYYCNGIPNAQQWQFAAGQLRIDTSWCLDVSSADPTRATNAILNQCDTEGARIGQYWNLVDGMVQVSGTNVCLTLADANATVQKYMQVSACDPNNPRQQWAVANYSSTGAIGVSISNQADLSKCLDVYAGKTTPGAVVDIYTCNRTPAQQWVWQSRALQALGSCLEASNTSVSMQPCDAANSMQQWVTDKGHIKLLGTERCLDLTNGKTDDATPLSVAACSTAQSQQWVWGAPSP